MQEPRITSDFGITILRGGFFHHREEWREVTAEFDFFRLWFPVRGSADIGLNGVTRPIRAGRVYFIPRSQLTTRARDCGLDLYWMHFKPQWLYLDTRLGMIERKHEWPASAGQPWRKVYARVDDLVKSRPIGLEAQTCAMAMWFVGDLLNRYPAQGDAAQRQLQEVERLQPAVTLMDRQFRRNPPLSEIAEAAQLSPVYFHRRFTRAFRVTPHDYMEQKRMRQAREQLAQTRLSIADIAAEAGYDNAFYFSRRFKALFGMSPREFRAQQQHPGP